MIHSLRHRHLLDHRIGQQPHLAHIAVRRHGCNVRSRDTTDKLRAEVDRFKGVGGIILLDQTHIPACLLQGKGSAGVRSQGHAETLTSNASPRFKDRALSVERSVAEVGSLALTMLRAMDPRTVVAWLKPDTTNPVAMMEPDDPTLEPPAPGMKQFPFKYWHLPDNTKVTVDSHSASPIFSREARDLIFALVKIGAMTPEDAIEHLHPAGEEEIIAETEAREIQQAALLKAHPEIALKLMEGGKGRRR